MTKQDKLNILQQKIRVISGRGDLDKRQGVLRKLKRQERALKADC